MFPYDWIQVMHFWKEYRGGDAVHSSVHHIMKFMMLIRLITSVVNPDHFVNMVSARFLYYQFTIFPFVIILMGIYFEGMLMSCYSVNFHSLV